ncbi:hypothetical protein BJ912DRAFT_557726 [Pholiota molesta]|nr:hypothetical protein BJ912DRAFT_557726 [Pholiota molesta]
MGSMASSPDAHTPALCPQCILPELATLSISLHHTVRVPFLVPLSILFTGLHLPSLRTLSLSAPDAKVWENRHALLAVYTVLGAAPAVTKLALEYTRSFNHTDTPAIAIPPTIKPIWARATELAHLQLALPPTFMGTEERDEVLRLFVRHIFSAASVWLDLRNPACPIRANTISDSGSALPISDLTMASVRESAGEAPEVAFEITSESARQAAADVRKEWGARIR